MVVESAKEGGGRREGKVIWSRIYKDRYASIVLFF